MKNIKGIAFANDGAMTRMAITFDEINEEGKIINSNAKVNRVVMDVACMDAIETITNYAASIINEQ